MKILQAALFLALSLTVVAQTPGEIFANPKLHNYTWKSQTQILVGAEVKSTVIQQITWTPSAEQQQLELSRTSSDAKKPIMPVRRRLAKRKASKSKEWFQGLEQQLALYRHPTPEQIQNLKRNLTTRESNGQLVLSGQNFVQSGDEITLLVDPKSKQPGKGEISTRYDDSEVKIHLTFSQLEAGLSTISKTVCEIPDHDIVINVVNSDYSKTSGAR